MVTRQAAVLSSVAVAAAFLSTGPAAWSADGGEIPGWGIVVNPDGDAAADPAAGGALTLTAPGPVHDLSAELDKMNAPRVLRPAQGDFTAVVTVTGGFAPGRKTLRPRKAYHGAGLVAMADDENYVRLERATFRTAAGSTRHYGNFEVRIDGKISRLGQARDMPLDPSKPTQLRLERRGTAVSGFVRQGDGPWKSLGTKRIDLHSEPDVGVCAVNTSTAPFDPTFSGLSITPEG